MITSICTTVYTIVYQLLLKSINLYNYNYSTSQGRWGFVNVIKMAFLIVNVAILKANALFGNFMHGDKGGKGER